MFGRATIRLGIGPHSSSTGSLGFLFKWPIFCDYLKASAAGFFVKGNVAQTTVSQQRRYLMLLTAEKKLQLLRRYQT